MTATADPSTRFVLSEEDCYVRNLAALWAAEPELAAAIEALEGEAGYPLEASKSGAPTVAAPASDGRRIYLHSRHRPIEEAKRLVESIDSQEEIFHHIFGLGLGYHLEALFERSGDEAIFCVFEPDLLMIRAALEARPLTRIIESRRVFFFWKLDKADLFFRLMPQTSMISLGTQELVHAASAQRHGEFFEQMREWTEEFAGFCRTNMNTLLLNGRRTLENIARNSGWYAATPCQSRLRDRYKKNPAVIVSAGPSLRKNKHLLKDLQGRAVIIAVQTTLQPLLEMGVEPDFVTSLDYHDICTRFFQKLSGQIKTELIAEPKATNLIFSLHTGPVSLIGNDMAENLLREMRIGKSKLQSGSTVAHLAYYLAELLGCDPIIFVGQDLGFSDGLYYIPGTSYEDVWRPELGRFCTVEMKNWEQIARERPILRRVPDQQGRPIYTEERLYSYLQQFERDFGRTSARIIDATEGGVAKRGAGIMTLQQAIEQFCREPLPAVQADYPGLNWSRLEECIASLRLRKQEAHEIETISRQTLPVLEEIHEHLDDQQRVNRLIAKVDSLRSKMNAFGPTYDLVMQFTQPTELKRFTADRKIVAAKLEGSERQRRQVARDIDNVRAVAEAAVEFAAMMDRLIEQMPADARQNRKAA